MRGRAKTPAALAVGSAANGLLAYIFFALSTRTLGAEAAAPVSVLWTYWSFAAAALTFPLQHWIARSVAAHEGEGSVRDAMPRVVALVVTAALVVGVLSWLGRDQLFHRDDLWFPLLVVIVTLGSGFIGIVRGGLSARDRFVAVAWALGAENGLRCAGAVVLILAGVENPVAYGACLACGALVGFFWPSSFRFSREQARPTTESALRFISGAAGGQLIGQAVLTGGPVVLALSGGSPSEVTALFAGLALFRAPYTLAIGLVSALTGYLTRLVVLRRTAALRRFRLGVLLATAVGVVGAAVIGATIGPWLLRLIFGSEIRLDDLACGLVAVGSAVALANLVVTVSIMSQNRSTVIARSWFVGIVGAVLVFVLTSGLEPLLQTCWAFVAAEVLAFVVLAFEDARAARTLRPGGGTTPVSESARRPRSSSA